MNDSDKIKEDIVFLKGRMDRAEQHYELFKKTLNNVEDHTSEIIRCLKGNSLSLDGGLVAEINRIKKEHLRIEEQQNIIEKKVDSLNFQMKIASIIGISAIVSMVGLFFKMVFQIK